MHNPTELLYTTSHEWVKKLEDGTVLVGLTDYAQHHLGDLVYVNLPEEGDDVEVGEELADVESVKAVSDVFSPVTGKVVEINEELLDHPEMANSNPYDAWLVKIGEVSAEKDLLDAAAYDELCAKEEE